MSIYFVEFADFSVAEKEIEQRSLAGNAKSNLTARSCRCESVLLSWENTLAI